MILILHLCLHWPTKKLEKKSKLVFQEQQESIKYSFLGPNSALQRNPRISKDKRQYLFPFPCSEDSIQGNAHQCYPYEVIFSPGLFSFECWGSFGRADQNSLIPGKGGYVKGVLLLNKTTTLYLYIGGRGMFNSIPYEDANPTIGWNYWGGGAADIRLVNGTWSNFNSLKSRIMVAGGGGGSEWKFSVGGDAGGLQGRTGYGTDKTIWASGGTQTSGGTTSGPTSQGETAFNGRFGMTTAKNSNDLGGVGGGGYYGGASRDIAHGGGGGSSFISGYPGCNAITKDSTDFTNIKHTGKPFHYSGLIFNNATMKAGDEEMPDPETGLIVKGNSRNGYIRITNLSPTSKFTHSKPLKTLKRLSLLNWVLFFTF